MTYTAKDIEVFFFAHNRAAMLRQALDCYLNQTVKGARLILLANAPTEEVLQVARDYAAKGVELVYEAKSLNVYGCVQRCRELASRPITVMAHDDDLIHPAYLKTILKAYNQIPHLNVAVSAMGDWNDKPFSPQYNTQCTVLENASEFSAYIFLGHSFTFSSASYRTETLKRAPAPDFDTYGKVQDVPFMLGACLDGKAAVLQYPFIKYRIHDAQDCQTFSTGPTALQWLALKNLHKKLMSAGGEKLRRAYGFNIYHRLRIGWKDWCRCEHDKMTFKQYLDLAKQKGVLTCWQQVIGCFLRGSLRQRVLNHYFMPSQITLCSIAIHLHLYYMEKWPEIRKYLQNLAPNPYHLYITLSKNNPALEQEIRQFCPHAVIWQVPNKGYDVGPFIDFLHRIDLSKYDFILKLHAKKQSSIQKTYLNGREITSKRWVKLLMDALLSSSEIWKRNLDAFSSHPSLGMLSSSYAITSEDDHIAHLRLQIKKVLDKMNLPTPDKLAFAAGTMFLVRAFLLEPLKAHFTIEDFERSDTSVQDGTLAHVFERVFGALCTAQGYDVKGFDKNRCFEQLWPMLLFIYRNDITSHQHHIIKICKIPVYYKKEGTK